MRDFFYMKVIKTIILTKIVTDSLLYLSLSFLRNQKQESKFKQVGGLVTRNISIFSISFKAMPKFSYVLFLFVF